MSTPDAEPSRGGSTKFSWAQRRRDSQKDLDEFRRLEQLVAGSQASGPPESRLHIDQVRQRSKKNERPPSILVDRFFDTAPAQSRHGPDECRGLVPGLESRRELNAAVKAELSKLNSKVASLTAELEAARSKIMQLETNATASADCTALAKQNAKLRERNRELVYQVKQGIEKTNSTADDLQAERVALNNEKQKFLKEMRKQKAELDRQSQMLLQSQLPDRSVRERVEQAEAMLASQNEKSQFAISKLKAQISRQKIEIDQAREANAQLKADLQAIEARRLQHWQDEGEGDRQTCSSGRPDDLSILQKSLKFHTLKEEPIVAPIVHSDGRVVTAHQDGTVVTKFTNGSVKTVYRNGHIKTQFANGDERSIYPDREEYRYASDQILHTILLDGVQIFEFPGGQRETHFPDGRKKIIYPDGVMKDVKANGDFEVHYPNGQVRGHESESQKRYKCSICIMVRFCSMPCYKQHRTDGCAPQPVSEVKQNLNENGPKQSLDSSLLSPEQIELLENSEELKRILANPELQSIITDVVISKNPQAVLAKTLDSNQHFVEFVDLVLNSIRYTE